MGPMARLVRQDRPGPLACAWGLAKQEQACLGGNGAVCSGCGGIERRIGAHCSSLWAFSFGARAARFFELLLAVSAVLRGRCGWRERSSVGT